MEVCDEYCFIARHRCTSSCLPLGFDFAVVEGDGRGYMYQPLLPCIYSCVEAKRAGQNESLEKFHSHFLTCKEK